MKIRIILSILMGAVLFSGCGAPSPKPMATEAIFGGVMKENVFDAAIKVLHFTGYTVQAISRDSGLISTDWFVFKLREGGKGKYKMNMLIYEDEERQIRFSIKVKAAWDRDEKQITTEPTALALINNMVGGHINRIFAEIGKVVGAPKLMGQFTVKLE